MKLNKEVCKRCLNAKLYATEPAVRKKLTEVYERRWRETGCVTCVYSKHILPDGTPEDCPYLAEHTVSQSK